MVGANGEKQWYAVRVKSRHEKKVSSIFEAKGISRWLPLLNRRKRWSDRYVTVAEPLFPGYVFAYLEDSEHRLVDTTRGVVRLVSFNGRPAPIPGAEIEAVRRALDSDLKCDPYPLLKVGRKVAVTRGPLKNHTGELLAGSNNCRVLLSIPLIGQGIAVELNSGDVKPL